MSIPIINQKQTGDNIKSLRKARGLSVGDLQKVLGFNSPQAIYKWQTGAAMPTLDNLLILSAVFSVKIDDILVVNNIAM